MNARRDACDDRLMMRRTVAAVVALDELCAATTTDQYTVV